MDEAFAPPDDWAVRLPVFEGPLDLLLYLIRRNEIDIHDIPIEAVTRQYLDILGSMERMNLEIAGEFFVMASTLMYIKSRMLLPQKDQVGDANEDDEEDVDPRWELVQQLLEYKRFKEAASEMERLISANNDLLARYGPKARELAEERPLKPVDRLDVWDTFNQVLRRLAERVREGEIHAEKVTVADQMEVILNRLRERRRFRFTELFGDAPAIGTIVAAFLAILELARLNRVRLEQEATFDDIHCYATDPDTDETADLGAAAPEAP